MVFIDKKYYLSTLKIVKGHFKTVKFKLKNSQKKNRSLVKYLNIKPSTPETDAKLTVELDAQGKIMS